MEGEQLENSLDGLSVAFVNFNDTSTVLSHILVAVGSKPNEPALLNASGESLSDVDRLLLSVETRHVRERTTHHTSGGIAVGRLGDGNEGDVEFGLQTFQFDVVVEVSGSPVELVEQKPVYFQAVFLGELNEFLECLALIALRCGLSDTERNGRFRRPEVLRSGEVLLPVLRAKSPPAPVRDY